MERRLYALYSVIVACSYSIDVASYTHVVINKTKFPVTIKIGYKTQLCRDVEWRPLKPGERTEENAGICTLDWIGARTKATMTLLTPLYLPGGNVIREITKEVDAQQYTGPFIGNGTWEVQGNDPQKLKVVQVSSQNLGQIIEGGITDAANTVGKSVKDAAEDAYKESKKIYNTVLDTLTAGKLKEGAEKLRSVAHTLEQLPNQIKNQITDITKMPDKLTSGVADVDKSIGQIQTAEKDLQKQKTDVVNQNLPSKGLKELTDLNKALMQAFDELEKGLTSLANASGNTGILPDFKTALMQAKKEAETGLVDIQNHLNDLNNKINKPSLGYPSLPDRIRAIASILNP